MKRALCLCLAFAVLSSVAPVRAQAQDRATENRVRARTLRQYEAGGLHRLLLGDLNRDLWSLEIEVPVLDLQSYAGGLTPLRRGGGLQTTSLRFQAGDGQIYTFRSIDKDVTRNLDPLLRETVAARVMQDLTSSLFPLSAMVVAPLLEAADVLHADPDLVVMPSDPALGEFREDFAGLLGWIEVRPDEGPDGRPGFAGSSRVVGSDRFRERLEESPSELVDARAYLRARLMDLFVGDWDRHPDQWRWAAFEDGDVTRWEPIPRDRDWALASIDGLLISLGRPLWPHYVGFSGEYESVFGTTWNGRALDRHLLSSLDREQFLSVAEDLQRQLTDAVIGDAVARLPVEYLERVGARLEERLLSRRDDLVTAAAEYYSILGGWVDLIATDADEVARVERRPDGTVAVSITEQGQASPYLTRTFDPAETHEVRLFMRGGEDRIEVAGTGPDDVTVRAIGGGGDDAYVDRTTGRGIYFYDHRGDNEFDLASATSVDERHHEEPEDTESETHQARPRDWGHRWYTFPMIGANTDIGVFAGQTSWRDSYGFRHFPYRTRLSLQTSFNPVELGVAGLLRYEFPLASSGPGGEIELSGSTREVRHYFGTGNETTDDAPGGSSFFRADRAAVGVGLWWTPPLGEHLDLRLGPGFMFSTNVNDEDSRFVGSERPYGFGDFGALSLQAELELDSRDEPGFPRSGGVLELSGRFSPSVFDAEEAYGSIRGLASINIAMGSPVLSLKVAGEKVWGRYPYFDGALLGGANDLRGFMVGRFVGDASVLGSAQLRIPVADYFFVLPGTLGIHGLVDVGRVYFEGEDSDEWHTAFGGGLWASIFQPKYTLGLTLAGSDEGVRWYMSMGFKP